MSDVPIGGHAHPAGEESGHLTTTAEELLAVVQEMFPAQVSQAIAELTIRKQAAEITRLNQLLNDRSPT